MKLLVVLTQYKRNHLENQLKSIYSQTLKPDYIVVFQNENYIDIIKLKEQYNFIHIKSDYNTKYFGRFSICFSFPVDYCVVLDDDIIPGKNCLKNHIEECIRLNGIIGGSGRIGYFNEKSSCLKHPPDVGNRNQTTMVDFVGHLWCFKKIWLHYMFSIEPFTYDTGEDMHLCYSSKLLGNINSYTCIQNCIEDMSDITNNELSVDSHSSFLTTSQELRQNVEKYFIDNYNLKLIEEN
jgi:hypothetical protein